MTEKEKFEEILKDIKKITTEIFETEDLKNRLHVIDICLDAYNLLLKLPNDVSEDSHFNFMISNIKDNFNHLKSEKIDVSTFDKYRHRMWSDIDSAALAFKMYSGYI